MSSILCWSSIEYMKRYLDARVFKQGIGYKHSSREHLAGILLDEIYLETKQNVDTLLALYHMINIVSEENNNQVRNRTLNITILTKNYLVLPYLLRIC